MRKNLIPFGKLDLDSDLYSISEGDYPYARNIVISTGKGGGNNIIKTLESIKDVGFPSITGTEKAIAVAPNGKIYELFVSGANAFIYVTDISISSRVLVLQYAHEVVDDFTPDLKVLGDLLFWNYYQEGTPLMWNTIRADGSTVLASSLIMAKPAPVNILTITKSVNVSNSLRELEEESFQFASTYRYDTGESSVLSPFTSIFKGEKGTEYYQITVSLSSPNYVEDIDIYARSVNGGSWVRIRTIASGSGTTSFNWKGEYFESLAESISATSFSAIPSKVKAIEAALDRIWFGNFEDDYADNGSGSLLLTIDNGRTLAGGGTIKNYLGADTTSASIKSSESGTYYKPFANNSQYLVGVAFFDSALKTKGVEFITTIKTGLFTVPHNPIININSTGYTKPSWAKYMQLCISQNLSKVYSYEGFANSIYFEIEQEDTTSSGAISKTTKVLLSVKDGQESKVKSCVLDISGIYSTGYIYTFNTGDRCDFRCKDGAGAYRTLSTKVTKSEGDKIYLEWNGGLCSNDVTPDAEQLYFEIYSPLQTGEDSNILLYGVGNLIDVSVSIPSSITDYKIGDSVWKQISFKENTEPKLVIGYGKSVPAIIVEAAITVPKIEKPSGNQDVIFSTGDITGGKKTFHIPFTDMSASNDDNATIVDGACKMVGYYDNYTSIIEFKYDITIDAQLGVEETASVYWSANVVRVPFIQETASYGQDVYLYKISDNINLESGGAFSDDISGTTSFTSIRDTHKIANGDLLKVVLEVDVFVNGGGSVNVGLKNKNGVTLPLYVSIEGNRIAPTTQYYNKEKVTVSATDTTFVVRAANFDVLEALTTTPGKPYLQKRDNGYISQSNSFRHGGNIVQGTSQNDVSLFSALDTYTVPLEHGQIMSIHRSSRLQGDGTMLLVLCENETSYALLGEINYEGADGSVVSALSSNIVGSIRTLEEKTGIQSKSSVYTHNGVVYWWDNAQSKVYMLDRKLTAISDNGVSSYFANKSGIGRFAFDPHYKMLLVNIGKTESLAYDLDKKEWKAFFDINFDFSLQRGNRCLYIDSGKIYRSLENTTGNKFNEFMNVIYNGRIDMPLNTFVPVVPLIVQINHSMDVNDFLQPNFIKTSLMEVNISNENGQDTTLKESSFLFEQNKLYGYVLRDSNSPGGIINGDFITGCNTIFSLILKNNTIENRIFALSIEVDKNTGHIWEA